MIFASPGKVRAQIVFEENNCFSNAGFLIMYQVFHVSLNVLYFCVLCGFPMLDYIIFHPCNRALSLPGALVQDILIINVVCNLIILLSQTKEKAV